MVWVPLLNVSPGRYTVNPKRGSSLVNPGVLAGTSNSSRNLPLGIRLRQAIGEISWLRVVPCGALGSSPVGPFDPPQLNWLGLVSKNTASQIDSVLNSVSSIKLSRYFGVRE